MNELKNIFKDRIVGAQMLFYSKGKTYKYNYGYASLDNMMLVEDHTIFRIASISKIIVAMAALKLMEQGKLDINADISDIFGFKINNPQFPNEIISTKMLMLHTSSILDGYDDEELHHNGIEKGYNGVNGKKYFVALKDLLVNEESSYYTSKTFGNYKPGTKFNYSNFGTGILACIVEVVSGRLFTEFVETEILKPLNVDASFLASNLDKKDLLSDTFYYDEKAGKFKTNKDAAFFLNAGYPTFPLGNNFRGPAGGLYISMQDLNKIMQVLLHDGVYEGVRILEKATIDLMLQMHYLGDNDAYLAKGLQLKFIDHFNDVLLKGHTGNAYGVRSFMFFSKEHDYGTIFIANGGIYQEFLPDFNDISYQVLAFSKKHYLQKTRRVVKIASDLKISINERKIRLNNYKIINDELYLRVMDLANILDVIPRIKGDSYYIKNIKIAKTSEFVALEKTLEKLKINYEKSKNNDIVIKL